MPVAVTNQGELSSNSVSPRARVVMHPGRSQSGASLIEVVLAALMLSIVALGLVECFALARVWFDHKEHKRVASQEQPVAATSDAINVTASEDVEVFALKL